MKAFVPWCTGEVRPTSEIHKDEQYFSATLLGVQSNGTMAGTGRFVARHHSSLEHYQRRTLRRGGSVSDRELRNLRRLKFALLALLILMLPMRVEPHDLPPLTMKINDFASVLDPSYAADLNRRLIRFGDKTGYAIWIVLIADDYNQNLTGAVQELFELNQLEKRGSAGTVLLVIDTQNSQVAIATSRNLRSKFSGLQVKYQNMLQQYRGHREWNVEVESAVDAVLTRIDPWFYVLDPPSVYSGTGIHIIRSPTAEIILFPLAPLVGLMTGIVLMAFTSIGGLPVVPRFFVSGSLGCLVIAATSFLIRQRGGISPGILYYAAGIGFVVSAAVGALRPFWFTDKFKGRRAGEPGPVYFRWG
jgi:hypothetical protein